MHPEATSIASRPERLTLGVEEEFHLVDLATRRPTACAKAVLEQLRERRTRATDLEAAGNYAAELQQSVVETNTAVSTELEQLRRYLIALRSELIQTAEALGIGIAAAGTMPLSAPLTLTETPRFERMLADYQSLVREQLICGMQVHVGIPDRNLAARLLDRVSPWLPPLLALSVSSPFSQTGSDSGYASTRSLIWSRWPTTGRAGAFASAREYDELVKDLVATGVISDPGMIYFDVRPSAHVPTIELRICDACPCVDSVLLIAGLFRAIVSRECLRLAAGEPSAAPPIALERAALWRAARSGLEGELIDLSRACSVPAALLLRSLARELRPELDAQGDTALIEQLLDGALARGSSAARQREAVRERGDVRDAVDLILAETRGESPAAAHRDGSALLRGYRAPAFDEGLQPDGRARGQHGRVLPLLSALGAGELRERVERLEHEQEAAGIVFRPSAERAARPLPIDVVPRLLSGEEWSRIQGGTAQRARALDAFVRDIYGPAAIVRDGVLPEWLVQQAPGYRKAGAAPGEGARRVQVAGFDIVRDADGRWLVLEDNVRVPSGVAYALHCRRLLRQQFPELFAGVELLDPEQAPALLFQALCESAPAEAPERPRVVLLSSGPADSAYFEHRFLAGAMGIALVEPKDLVVSDERLWRVEAERREAVDVVYLRMDEQLSHRRGADGAVLGPRLLAAVRKGRLTLANALGNGVADDKAIYAHVPKFIEYYLGERPLLEQVPTFHCADDEQREHVLARLEELVVKPVDGYGGLGVVIGPDASQEELRHTRQLILQQPGRWIAQETVALSTHPTLSGKRVSARHVDLRVFVYYGEQPVVAPAALTRVAPAGSRVVNSSRGGGMKDTWLLK